MKKVLALFALLFAAAIVHAQVTITNVYVSATTSTTATFHWTTSGPATSMVRYGFDISLPFNNNADPTLVTDHTSTLKVLSASQPYYFAVVSVDGSGNSTQSTTQIFTLCGAGDTGQVPAQGTVNNYYQYGTFTATWVPPAGSPGPPTICGNAMTQSVSGTLSGGATLSMSVSDSYKAVPGPGTWHIAVNDAGNIAPVSINFPVSSQSNDFSHQLQVAAAAGGLTAVIANLITHDVYPPFICTSFNGACGGGGATLPTNAIVYGLSSTTSRAAVLTDFVNTSAAIWTGSPCGVGTNALLVNGQCGAPGGGSPVGLGTIQTANAGGTAFFSLGIINTETLNTSNNGISQTQATLCTATYCSIVVPPTSTDSEIGGPLPIQGSKKSAFEHDYRGNRLGTFGMNPVLSPNVIGTDFQSMFLDAVVYTEPSQVFDIATGLGGHQGKPQGYTAVNLVFATPGYSNGQQGCASLFCALPQYGGGDDVSDWTNTFGYSNTFLYYTPGIKEANSETLRFYATGDSDAHAMFVQYAGGTDAPSDEGEHAMSEIHNYTVSDYVCTVGTVTDGNHLFCPPIPGIEFNAGGGRFLIKTSVPVIGTDSSPLFQVIIDKIHTPGDGHPYGTIDSSTAHFPVSYAIGSMTGNCAVPAQQGTFALGTDHTPTDIDPASCDVTVSSGVFDTNGIVCTWIQVAKLFNCGQVTNVIAGAGGHQKLTMTMNRSVPGGAFVFQGGMAGTAIDFKGDDVQGWAQDGHLIRGSVYPIMGSLDAHTVIYVAYDASQSASGIPRAGTQSGSRAIAGATGSGINGMGFTAINLVRTSNVVTATITTGGQQFPPIYQILNNADFINISGCSDATMNSAGIPTVAKFIAENPLPVLQYTMPGSNADSTCTTATIAMQNTVATYFWAAETTDVMNHADGIPATQVVDGTFAHSYQPNFVPGDTLDQPTHYAANSDILNLDQRMSQPGNSGGITISLLGNAAINGSAIFIYNQYNPVLWWGQGGRGFPANVLQVRGNWASGFVMEEAPIGGGSVITAGFSPCNPTICQVPSLRNFNIFAIGADVDGGSLLRMEPITDTLRLVQNSVQTVATWNLHGSRWESDFSMANPIFRGWDGSTNSTSDMTHIQYCSLIQPGTTTTPPCYSQPLLPAPTVNVLTTGSTEYIYVILEFDAAGNRVGWSNFTDVQNAAVTANNTISCNILPAGTSGSVYVFVNPIMKLVGSAGACTNPSTVVTDNGTYGPNLNHQPTTDFVPFYSGDFAATGVGYLGFRQRDFFGTSTSAFTITAQMTQPVDGTFSFDTTTMGNHLAEILVGTIGSGTASNTDQVGELSFSTATTASYSFTGTYTSHPECTVELQFDPTTATHWVTYTGVASFTVNFSTAVTGNVTYTCHMRN